MPLPYIALKISYNTHKDKWSINELLTMCVQEDERLAIEEGEQSNLTTYVRKGKNQVKSKEISKLPPQPNKEGV